MLTSTTSTSVPTSISLEVSPTAERDDRSPIEQAESALVDKPNVEKILCQHCKRTATNGIKCKGICVADDNY